MSKITGTKWLTAILTITMLAFNTGCFRSTAPEATSSGGEIEATAPCGVLVEDLNGDGYVNASDLAYFARAQKADVNNDGKVDQADVDRLGEMMNLPYPENLEDLTASELALAVRIIAADLNEDHSVDASDLAVFASLKPMAETADVNGDGFVDDADLRRLEDSLGHSISPCESSDPV